ncbi:hypothetical protein [Streptomyces albogriseolus]|uniref:hypothetical protein n=1 Tax=Streptomyces albogriseolus TaxID=1887 RepID=UPI003F4A1739
MTDQKAPEGLQERPEGGLATPRSPEGESGPQAGAQGFDAEQHPRGPVDWARHYADQRETQGAADPRQDGYDAVWAYIRELGDYMPPTTAHRNAAIWRGVHAALDAANVPALQPPARIDAAPAHNAGPTVAECAEADRRWPLQKHGE